MYQTSAFKLSLRGDGGVCATAQEVHPVVHDLGSDSPWAKGLDRQAIALIEPRFPHPAMPHVHDLQAPPTKALKQQAGLFLIRQVCQWSHAPPPRERRPAEPAGQRDAPL